MSETMSKNVIFTPNVRTTIITKLTRSTMDSNSKRMTSETTNFLIVPNTCQDHSFSRKTMAINIMNSNELFGPSQDFFLPFQQFPQREFGKTQLFSLGYFSSCFFPFPASHADFFFAWLTVLSVSVGLFFPVSFLGVFSMVIELAIARTSGSRFNGQW